jgi:hypothetical protein
MSNDPNRFDIYRHWLISVLYLNTTNPGYFCVCMGSIETTYRGKFIGRGTLAVEDYLRKYHPECAGPNADKQFTQDSMDLVRAGIDATHLPPLDSLDLGFLLKNAVPPSTGEKLPSQYLASFTSSPNPFIKGTTLEFILNRTSYITIAIYDELGRLVWGDGKGSSLEAGTHAIHLDGNILPSGTLYVRIATGFGEVKTVKLVHDK